jgi:1-aminocyclopropane-1-carboxylate deaminase/D-cysteine desulfhydrase-like pyridoxal-dependent ACC family enzyme
LTKALFQIRAAVGRANDEAGISDVLAQAQQLDDIIGIKSMVANLQARKEVSEINARIVKIKSSTGTDRASVLYGDRYNVVETGVLNNDRIDQTKAEVKMLKRDRQELNDKLLSLNVNTTIQLSDSTLITLQSEGII